MNYYIFFAGIIEQNFANRLVTAINEVEKIPGISKIIIIFSSLGGNIQEGFTIASIIQNAKIPIAIHANNNIDSIANVIYLSAKERTAESYAKFYLHGASTPSSAFDEKGLMEQMSSIKTENARISQFISENSGLNLKKVQDMMKIGSTFTAQQAIQNGIVQSVVHLEVPLDAPRAEIIVVN